MNTLDGNTIVLGFGICMSYSSFKGGPWSSRRDKLFGESLRNLEAPPLPPGTILELRSVAWEAKLRPETKA